MRNEVKLVDDIAFIRSTNSDCVAVIDKPDLQIIGPHSWFLGSCGYLVGSTFSKGKFRLHEKIMGTPPGGLVVDHIDGNKLNNRRVNLRFVTRAENNLSVKRQENGIPYVGVFACYGKNGIRFYTQKNAFVPKSFSGKSAEHCAVHRDIELIRSLGLNSKTNLLPPFPADCEVTIK